MRGGGGWGKSFFRGELHTILKNRARFLGFQPASGLKSRNLARFSALLGRFPSIQKFVPTPQSKGAWMCVLGAGVGEGRFTKTGKCLRGQTFSLQWFLGFQLAVCSAPLYPPPPTPTKMIEQNSKSSLLSGIFLCLCTSPLPPLLPLPMYTYPLPRHMKSSVQCQHVYSW